MPCMFNALQDGSPTQDKVALLKFRLLKRFTLSCGIILFITAIAKIVGSFGAAKVLAYSDPMLGIQFRHLMLIAGSVEIVSASMCFFQKKIWLANCLIAWLSISLLIYRFGMWWIGWHSPCACLGTLTDTIHIRPQVADIILKLILLYFVIGSSAALFWFWRLNGKCALSSSHQQ
jgi:hypothetical protein